MSGGKGYQLYMSSEKRRVKFENLKHTLLCSYSVLVTFCNPRGTSGFNPFVSARFRAKSCPGIIVMRGVSHSGTPEQIGRAVLDSESACSDSEITSSSASRRLSS